ncbi:LytTR family DNA-binding domain-containing protein [Ideonella sp. BN130291]|uniref:LytTR family DNA-binding domain-containing protein n=1 Tax=Ideonella sp. BN130291 TaxID=3112940 RepID=UPI002E26128D|nr:LytTR family transcriptional regulator DNA-binding domain-containing protein [Ideonella sp. BN130291]
MSTPDPDLLQRFLARRRVFEVGFWCLLFSVQTVANTITVWIDVRRMHLPFALWEPLTWEASSNFVWLALVPVILAVLERWPLHWGVLRAHLPVHLAASLLVSVVHVVAMVAVRHAVYAAHGARYDFGHWPTELAYEALKDVRSYTLFVLLALSYRLLLWRLQGEASLLQPPDDDPPAAEARPADAQPGEGLPADAEPAEPPQAAPPERFLVKKLGKEFLLPTDEIEWLQACGNYVNLHRRQHDYPLRSTLAAMERRLDAARFARVHRSYLVNLAMVEVIEPTEAGDARLRMKDGAEVPCSRTYLDGLRLRLR